MNIAERKALSDSPVAVLELSVESENNIFNNELSLGPFYPITCETGTINF